MPVTVTDTVSTYAGNGDANTAYAITIPRSRDEDLFLELDGVNSTDFTISPDGFRTGTALASTVKLVLYRATPRTQDQPFPSNTTPPAEDVRAAVDKLSLTTQEIDETVARSVQSAIGTAFAPLTALGFDSLGVPLARTATQEVAFLGLDFVISRIATLEAAVAALGGDVSPPSIPANALTFGGDALTFGGATLTYN